MTTATITHPEAGAHESPFVSRVKPPEPFTLVLFGATGDLAGRKLFPALQRLLQSKYLPQEFAIIGIGRRDLGDEEFRAAVRKSLSESSNAEESAATDHFLSY